MRRESSLARRGRRWKGSPLRVRFFGVRGSCPCSGPGYLRYGGNTSCVVVEADGAPPIVLDLGTGLRPYGDELDGGPTRIVALLSHLHWDHLIGLPFFKPALRSGTSLQVFGPSQPGGEDLHAVIDRVVQPPFFPVQVKEMHGEVCLTETLDGDMAFGSATVRIRRIPHLGTTLGFRIEADGAVLAFVGDHQAPDDLDAVDEAVLELCDGADLVIHDAQYTDEEFRAKRHWGHSTAAYAVRVATLAGCRRLALFHHDPDHDDDRVDRILADARHAADDGGLEVLAAAEGTALDLVATRAAPVPR